MKKNEIALIIIIVALSLGAGYLIGQSLLGGQTSKPVSVEKADPISVDVTSPDTSIFNKDAINPTVPVRIGNGGNASPFGN